MKTSKIILTICAGLIVLTILNHVWCMFYTQGFNTLKHYAIIQYEDYRAYWLDKFGVVEVSNKTIDSIIYETSKRYGIDHNLVRAVIKVESNFNPDAVSPVGAIGLMQVMPFNASRCGVKKYMLYDIEHNIRCGVQILSENIENRQSIFYGISEYNGGTKCLDKAGNIVCAETREYVVRVLKTYLDGHTLGK